jgi:hypothetical protein
LGGVILFQALQTPPPPPSLPTITGNQIYIAQIWHVTLSSMSSTGASQSVNAGSLLNFENGETIQTDNGDGYAYLGFPGQAQLYLGRGTQIVLKDVSAQFEILLNQGWVLINQPGRKFLVDTPTGAQVWVSGSMMGLHFDPTTNELYVDCLQDQCYVAGLNQPFPEGYHMDLRAGQVGSPEVGTHNEYWQFVPDLVATPTSTPTPTATPNIKATQACQYYQNQGTPCPRP